MVPYGPFTLKEESLLWTIYLFHIEDRLLSWYHMDGLLGLYRGPFTLLVPHGPFTLKEDRLFWTVYLANIEDRSLSWYHMDRLL